MIAPTLSRVGRWLRTALSSVRVQRFFSVVDWVKLSWLLIGEYALFVGSALQSGDPLWPAVRHATGAALVFIGGFLTDREKKDIGNHLDAAKSSGSDISATDR